MNNKAIRKVFSWDVETNGLWGKAFAIGAVIYENGVETKKFYARCPIADLVDPWVLANVLPQMERLPETHNTYCEMIEAFSEFFLENKAEADVIFHMGLPVEARVVIDMHEYGYIGDWDGAYPWLDIAGNLKQAGYNATSVDAYNASHGIKVPQPEAGGTHNPLYDSRAAALCYQHLMANAKR